MIAAVNDDNCQLGHCHPSYISVYMRKKKEEEERETERKREKFHLILYKFAEQLC